MTEKDNLFKNVTFHFIGNISDSIKQTLVSGGGKQDYYMSEMISHAIADEPSDEVSEAQDLFQVTVVTSKWVTMSVKCNKLLPVKAFHPDSTTLFRDKIFCPTQLSVADTKMLWAMITYYGGSIQLALDKKVTHLICKLPEGKKYEKASECGIKIVNPDWVQEVTKQGSYIPEDRYHPKWLRVIPTPEASPSPTPSPSPSPSPPVQIPLLDIKTEPVDPAELQSKTTTQPLTSVSNLAKMKAAGFCINISSPLSSRSGSPPPITQPVAASIHSKEQQPKTPKEKLYRMVSSRMGHSEVRKSDSITPFQLADMPPTSLTGTVVSSTVAASRSLTSIPAGMKQPVSTAIATSPPHAAASPASSQPTSPRTTTNSTLKNITNNAPDVQQSPSKTVSRISQMVTTLDQRQQQLRQEQQNHLHHQQQPQPPMMGTHPPLGYSPTSAAGPPMHHHTPPRHLSPGGHMSPRHMSPMHGSPRHMSPGQHRGMAPQQMHMAQMQQVGHMTGQGMVHSFPNQQHPQLPMNQQQHPMRPQINQADVTVYFGHDQVDSGKLPDEACLLGCVFYVIDYQKHMSPQQLENWKKIIENYGGQIDESYSNRITHVLCRGQKSDVFQMALRDQKRLVTVHWLNDVLKRQKMLPPWCALHFPVIYGQDLPCTNQVIAVTNFDGEDRVQLKHMIAAIGAKYTGYLTRANSVLVCKRKAGKKYQKAVEWGLPIVNAQWLSDLVLGHLEALKLPLHPKYEHFGVADDFRLELIKVAHLLDGWKSPLRIPRDAWKRFNNRTMPLTPIKRKLNTTPPFSPKRIKLEGPIAPLRGHTMPVVLITGLPEKYVEHLTRLIHQLRGAVCQSVKECTHLVSNRLQRTVKFVMALNICRHVVTSQWVEQSARENKFLDEMSFMLHDPVKEQQLGYSLREAMMRRRSRNRPLFQGLVFYFTPSVCPSKSTLKDIVFSAGGLVADKRPSIAVMIKQVTHTNRPAFIVVSCEDDLELVYDLTKRSIPVYSTEFVITGSMKQDVEYTNHIINL